MMTILMVVLLAVNLTAPSLSAAEQPQDGKKSVGTAKIKSDSTYYDRKEGFAYFSGHVFVDDAEYQLHTDRAYVFMNASNELQRIVALGHVAITNGTKRAYGEKASYYRTPGLVVLTAGEGGVAEVWDETKNGRQSVRGKKIKFWTGTEQMEVVEAELSAPSKGKGALGSGVPGLIGGK